MKAIEEVLGSTQLKEFFRTSGYGEHFAHLNAFLDQCSDKLRKMERSIEAAGLLRKSKHRSEFAQEWDALRHLSDRIDHLRKVVRDISIEAADNDPNVV